MENGTYHNPITKGGYPDPFICRMGDDCYTVTPSFSYFPGLPVFRSTNLVHWEQIGSTISRPNQLGYRNCGSSGGLWAAIIQYHESRFHIVNTLDIQGRTYRYNSVLITKDPEGEWSGAVIIQGAGGIDLPLYFDENDRMWYYGNMIPEGLEYPSHEMIYLCELDRQIFRFVGKRHIIYDGNVDHSLFMGMPRIYRTDGLYYLMTACGGTQANHRVSICRSRSLSGPYEPCPRNPVVTSRNLKLTSGLGVSVTGHGDLVQTQEGEQYMTLLGIRPYEREIEDYERYQPRKRIRTPDYNKNAQLDLSREMFFVSIAWDYDGWLLVDNHNGMASPEEYRPELPYFRPSHHNGMDNFEEKVLDMVWCMGHPVQNPSYSLTVQSGYLRMELSHVRLEDIDIPAMLVQRQQHHSFQAALAIEFRPLRDGEGAGLVLTQSERFFFLLVKEMREDRVILNCCRLVNDVRELLRSVETGPGRLYLIVEGIEGSYDFYYGMKERQKTALALGEDGSILSTLVANGSVGTYLGMYASVGHKTLHNHVDFDWLRYEIIKE